MGSCVCDVTHWLGARCVTGLAHCKLAAMSHALLNVASCNSLRDNIITHSSLNWDCR